MDGIQVNSPRHALLGAVAVIAIAVALLGAPAAARAGVLTRLAGACDGQTYERPFLRWLDPATYVLVPGGTFEGAAGASSRALAAAVRPRATRRAHRRGRARRRLRARRAQVASLPPGWTASGGASVVAGNESYFVHAAGESRSLALPPGSSATTPVMCLGLLHPTLRLFATNSGSVLSTLRITVLFEDSLGAVVRLPIAVLAGTGRWQPTLPAVVLANLLANLPGGGAAAAFEFTPLGGGGNWRIDDVYVDPHRTR